ncbi:hypothetical protein BJG92_01196 [Arthrobacter sp. SO5]|uniref:DUF4393 domain-containing protein n=1 Tax=Arthrobacter sp. SO5 TaxID=1897055 RepID=UPI001E643A25|nr:DUF4393 domain-containing protein [Arthrobacter sp. SO5]MCB5273672.1 hypothetical protein [Arthrobacter sp. SO5]
MTGGEVAAAAMVGKVVKHAGEQMAEENRSINKELLAGAKDSRYMTDASDQYAKRVAIRQAILTKMYLPIAKLFGVANEYFEGDFDKDMTKKLEDVPEENLVPPKASLAAPAMQQLGFSLDEPDLKEMYLNLLATASDNRSQGSAHPSFVEVIKQLSSDEISVLNQVLTAPAGGYTPTVTINLRTEGEEGWRVLQKNLIPLNDSSSGQPIVRDNLGTYIDNWIRLGLVEVSYTNHMTGENAYVWAEQRPELIAYKQALETTEGRTVEFDKGVMASTSFGKSFAKVVGITS